MFKFFYEKVPVGYYLIFIVGLYVGFVFGYWAFRDNPYYMPFKTICDDSFKEVRYEYYENGRTKSVSCVIK